MKRLKLRLTERSDWPNHLNLLKESSVTDIAKNNNNNNKTIWIITDEKQILLLFTEEMGYYNNKNTEIMELIFKNIQV